MNFAKIEGFFFDVDGFLNKTNKKNENINIYIPTTHLLDQMNVYFAHKASTHKQRHAFFPAIFGTFLSASLFSCLCRSVCRASRVRVSNLLIIICVACCVCS